MIVFSTKWQKEIMLKPYSLLPEKTTVIENYYPIPVQRKTREFHQRIFLSPTRRRYIKNKENLLKSFSKIESRFPEVVLDTEITSHQLMIERIEKAYAVLLVSLSEVSPNLVLHAIEYSLPVIMTRDTGIYDRLKDLAIFVDPLSSEDIARGIELLLDKKVYAEYQSKIMTSNFSHSWNEITQEFLDLYNII